MDSQECDEVYAKLLQILSENKLEWTVDQVKEQILLGKTIEKEIVTFKKNKLDLPMSFELEMYQTPLKKGPKVKFPVTEEYTPEERLELILDAIEQAIINTAEMENHLIRYFGTGLKEWRGVNFYAEETESLLTLISEETVLERFANSQHLKELIKKLRSEI